MSSIKAKITDIQTLKNLNIVSFEFYQTILTMTSLELSSNIKVGKEVILGVNSTHIGIAKGIKTEEVLSYANQIKCTIIELEIGELLSCVKLKAGNGFLESLITSKSAKRLNLELNQEVIALINSNELSIKEIL